jgi:hypothetical protein
MSLLAGSRIRNLLAMGILALAAVVGVPGNFEIIAAQSVPSPQISTIERIARPGWWPTKGTSPRSEYVGPAVCASCHASIAATQKQHNMARTLTRSSESEALHNAVGSSFRLGSFQYGISQNPEGGITATVSDATRSISDTLVWSFGSGAVGQTLLFERNGSFYETRFSLFPSAKTIDTTPNQRQWVARTLEQAAGRRLGEPETKRCFGCHSTAAVTEGRLDTDHLMVGVTCEGCHGPGAIHSAMMKSGMDQGTMLITNPVQMPPADRVDFCGACHGTSWDIVLSGTTGIENVRFPAYRLEKSRCWGKGDARMVCTACHNPYQPLVRDSASYDGKCQSCHVNTGEKATAEHPGAACKVGTKNCAGCHMAKYELPEMHTKYTDHYIRVVTDTSKFPDGPPLVGSPDDASKKSQMR